MLSLGFDAKRVQTLNGRHSRGMDAVRTGGKLLSVASISSAAAACGREELLPIRRRSEQEREERRCRRQIWTCRPIPYEDFPFTALVMTEERRMPPSLRSGEKFLDHMRASPGVAEPRAVAVCHPRKDKRLHQTKAWACFADQIGLDHFVEEWNGMEFDGQALRVVAMKVPSKAEAMVARRSGRYERKLKMKADVRAWKEGLPEDSHDGPWQWNLEPLQLDFL